MQTKGFLRIKETGTCEETPKQSKTQKSYGYTRKTEQGWVDSRLAPPPRLNPPPTYQSAPLAPPGSPRPGHAQCQLMTGDSMNATRASESGYRITEGISIHMGMVRRIASTATTDCATRIAITSAEKLQESPRK